MRQASEDRRRHPRRGLIEITGRVARFVIESGIGGGLLTLFLRQSLGLAADPGKRRAHRAPRHKTLFRGARAGERRLRAR